MPSLLWAILIFVCILWLLTRIVGWLLQWSLKHYCNVDAKIGKVGFFTFQRVGITLRSGIQVEIDQIWLSSCYINQEIRKPITLCIGEVRVQVNISQECTDEGVGNNVSGGRRKSGRREITLPNRIHYAQYLGLRIQNLTVMLLKTMLPDCLIHVKGQNVGLDCSVVHDGLRLGLNVEGLSCRALRSVTEASDSQSCLAEMSVGLFVDVTLRTADVRQAQSVRVLISKPQMMITEGFLSSLQGNRKIKRVPMSDTTDSLPISVQEDLLLRKYLPKEIGLDVTDLEVSVVRETKQRSLSVGLKTFHVDLFDETTDSELKIMGKVIIEEFVTRSPQANVAELNKFNMKTVLQYNDVHADLLMSGGLFHYHHEEVQYWLNVMHSMTRTQGEATQATERTQGEATQAAENSQSSQQKLPSALRNAATKFLLSAKFVLEVDLEDVKSAISTATCPGFFFGLGHAKMSCHIKPGLKDDGSWLQSHDITCELELQNVYCHQGEPPVSVEIMGSKKHHWHYVLHLGILLIKIQKLGQEVKVEGMKDQLRLEWSTKAVNALMQLIGAMKRSKRSSTPQSTKSSTLSPLMRPTGKSLLMTIKYAVTNVNIFICNDFEVCLMSRLDSVNIDYHQSLMSLQMSGFKSVYLDKLQESVVLLKSSDLVDPILHIKEVKASYKQLHQVVTVQIMQQFSCWWRTCVHMCLHQLIEDVQAIKDKFSVKPEASSEMTGNSVLPEPSSSKFSFNLLLQANVILTAELSSQHSMSIIPKGVVLSAMLPEILMEITSVEILFDKEQIYNLKGIMCGTLSAKHLKAERDGFQDLVNSTNRAWNIIFDSFNICFPYNFNFAVCFEQVVNMTKWLKLVHKIKKKAFTPESKLPADLQIKIKVISIQLCDDPFEVKVGDNYDLLKDESAENEIRRSVMDQKIQSLRKTHGLIPASKIEDLYSSLVLRSAEIYIQRSKQLYTNSSMRSKLFTWKMEDLEIVALADRSIHGKENVIQHMRDIDSESPYPEEGLDYTTLWCRYVTFSIKSWTILLRDYPQQMLDVQDMSLWGCLIGAEQVAATRAKRSCLVEVAKPWGDATVERSLPPLKFFHDFSCDVRSLTLAYGACWEPAIAQFNLAMDLVNKPSLDPSLPMPFWDKIRLLLHGRLTMSLQQMSWLYHASLDPFNTTELMDWTWSGLILDWTNAKFILKGDLDIYARTASKYDDCQLLHLPNLRFCIRLQWLCRGDANDHHAVMPCTADKVPEYSMEEHDSYRAFRSQNLNLNMSLDTKINAANPDDQPSCLFYASTLRFMDKIKMCLVGVARPIRRGTIFKNNKPKKLKLTRHYKQIKLSMNFPKFCICYWMSFSKHHGSELQADSFVLQACPELSLVSIEDGLFHQVQTNWNLRYLTCELNSTKLWLCSAQMDTEALSTSLRRLVDRNFFVSVSRVSYQRADETEEEENRNKEQDELLPRHRVQAYDMKMSWTKSNRHVLLKLFDGYTKAKILKRNLSSKALKGFKVEGGPQGSKSRTTSITLGLTSSPNPSTPSPLTKLQTGHAFAMLQKLVAETDSKSVAFTEETSGDAMDQLHGVVACQTDDVIFKNWQIDLHNAQMSIKGCETTGYVIVSMAGAKIISCTHNPVWRDRELRSKSTWVGSVECMQYYATVGPDLEENDDVVWLSRENVEDRSEPDLAGMPEMVGSGHSVGGVVSKTVGAADSGSVQLQRIISRCKCQFFYASYGDVEPDSFPEVPLPLSDDDPDMMQRQEGVDTFTLLHHDLNVCTNSLQYAMILDIVNNMLMKVEPKKKEAIEKLQSMKFQLQLSRVEDQKTPILGLQENVRLQVQKLRRLEKELYVVDKALEERPNNEGLIKQSDELEGLLNDSKDQIYQVNEELTTRISCFKESQLQVKAQLKKTKAQQVLVVRRNEVCFKFAQWRLTDVDGQLGIADLALRNFTYSKVNRSNESWTHQLELGWVKMTNLLPHSIYKDVLVPRDPLGKEGESRRLILRIMCTGTPPVGGIAVTEHFEVNVAPVQIQLTYHFFKTMMGFFFPGKNIDAEDQHDEDLEGSKKKMDKKHKDKEEKKASMKRGPDPSDDIDKMKERAAKNNTFLYIKIPDVPIHVSYKGEKEKNIEDVHEFNLVLPTLEYHNRIWTWFDLLMAMKNDSKRVLLSQAIKQKLHMKSRAGDEPLMTDVQQEEDKAKMLLGAKLLSGQEKPAKKSLFSKLKSDRS